MSTELSLPPTLSLSTYIRDRGSLDPADAMKPTESETSTENKNVSSRIKLDFCSSDTWKFTDFRKYCEDLMESYESMDLNQDMVSSAWLLHMPMGTIVGTWLYGI